jgi:trk system potassium uptake protein TrkA
MQQKKIDTFMIIGLGIFGSELAIDLLKKGHQVIGVDSAEDRVNLLKDILEKSFIIDSTDLKGMSTLPLKETDWVIVAIGENEGASLMTVGILKSLGLNKIICRSLSVTHEYILAAMNIHDIVHPEKEAAQQLSHRLTYNLGKEMLFIDNEHSVTETLIPSWMVNKKLADLDIRGKFKVNIISVLRDENISKTSSKTVIEKLCKGVITPEFVFKEGDIIVTFGKNDDIKKLMTANV